MSASATLVSHNRDTADKAHEADSATSTEMTQDCAQNDPLHDATPITLLHEVCGPYYFDEDDQKLEARPSRLCCVHGSEAEEGIEIHTYLTAACEDSHYQDTLIICTICLHECLKLKMFPLGDGDIKDRFPADLVRCWAPGCLMPLNHSEIRKFSDPEVFEVYDQALLERALARDETIVQCAGQDCCCISWVDENAIKSLERFRCPECCRETCRDCNDLYEKHLGQDCPSRKKRVSTKTRIEEFASRMRVARKHKCPSCSLRYEKVDGCDHITCGRTTWEQYYYGKLYSFPALVMSMKSRYSAPFPFVCVSCAD